MSADAQPAEIDGEYRCEENRKQKDLDSKHTVPKLTAQLLNKSYGATSPPGTSSPTESIANSYQLTPSYKCVGESQLTTVKLSKLDTLDTYDTASTAFIGKVMVVNYFVVLRMNGYVKVHTLHIQT
jgi:hypothetical protein